MRCLFRYSATIVTNNDLLRRIRYIFNFNDAKMVKIFAQAERKISQENIVNFLRREDEKSFLPCPDIELATFLNGLINERRGKKDGPQPEPERKLTNNLILRKLRIAMDYKDQDMIDTLKQGGIELSKHELSAFFRKVGHKHYRECRDQVLRNFLKGLQLKLRTEPAAEKSDFKWPTKESPNTKT